jgi:hypothetical protein
MNYSDMAAIFPAFRNSLIRPDTQVKCHLFPD